MPVARRYLCVHVSCTYNTFWHSCPWKGSDACSCWIVHSAVEPKENWNKSKTDTNKHVGKLVCDTVGCLLFASSTRTSASQNPANSWSVQNQSRDSQIENWQWSAQCNIIYWAEILQKYHQYCLNRGVIATAVWFFDVLSILVKVSLYSWHARQDDEAVIERGYIYHAPNLKNKAQTLHNLLDWRPPL